MVLSIEAKAAACCPMRAGVGCEVCETRVLSCASAALADALSGFALLAAQSAASCWTIGTTLSPKAFKSLRFAIFDYPLSFGLQCFEHNVARPLYFALQSLILFDLFLVGPHLHPF